MSRYIDADAFIKEVVKIQDLRRLSTATIGEALDRTPTADVVEVVRCKDCKYQGKLFHVDARRKDGGYYIYWCDLNDEYSHVCLDDDYCSRGERREA